MDRIGDAVRQELARFGSAGEMADLVTAWPEAVGETVARNAWPARVARDGTLHVNASSSAWAFELQQLEAEISGRLRDVLGASAPRRLRFAPGPLPEPETTVRGAPREAASGGDARAGSRRLQLGCRDRLGRSTQNGRKSCARRPRKGL